MSLESMKVDLSGQNAIVTGASQGLGRAMAVALGASGARVALVARNAEKLAETAKLTPFYFNIQIQLTSQRSSLHINSSFDRGNYGKWRVISYLQDEKIITKSFIMK